MPDVTLAQASALIAAALVEARTADLAPLTVVVLDSGGHLVAAQRQDGSGILRFEIATGKAYGALGLGLGSRALATRATTAPSFIAAAASAASGRLIPVPGGVLIRDAGGSILGAVGISGDASDQDEHCALKGIADIQLVGDPGV